MNAGNQLVAVVQMDCNSAILQTTLNLKSAGFQILQSFDLRSTTSATTVCPGHQAAYQMVVLMIYSQEGPPATLVFESKGSQTFVSLVPVPQLSTHQAWIEKMLALIPSPQLDFSSISPVG
jgi:hypothetical protein